MRTIGHCLNLIIVPDQTERMLELDGKGVSVVTNRLHGRESADTLLNLIFISANKRGYFPLFPSSSR